MKRILAFISGVVLLWSCGEHEKTECVDAPDVSTQKVEVSLEQFQDSLVNFRSKKQLVAFLTHEPLIRDYIFRRTEYKNDSVFINEIYNRFNNPHVGALLTETKKVYGDLSGLKAEFEQAFTNLKYYYPDFNPPKIQTLISGLDTDMFVSDSLIIVSLDYYLGPGAKYKPKVYDYLLRQYGKENIVPSSLLIYGISGRFNKTDVEDRTVLADMITYGKAFYFAKHMMPCVADSIFIWYTPAEINGSRKNQDLIWARLIEDKVLYSTSHVVKQKYLGERPKTFEVGEECPGRIAQWVGWQIVNQYMEEHPDETLPELMNKGDAQQLFKESNYKPRKQ
jgi:hypothetical protein